MSHIRRPFALSVFLAALAALLWVEQGQAQKQGCQNKNGSQQNGLVTGQQGISTLSRKQFHALLRQQQGAQLVQQLQALQQAQQLNAVQQVQNPLQGQQLNVPQLNALQQQRVT